jgi:hypothetical protein
MAEHVPTPYQHGLDGPAGVRCSCGSDFRIGASYPDTAKGNQSERVIRTMHSAWDLFREHWGRHFDGTLTGTYSQDVRQRED